MLKYTDDPEPEALDLTLEDKDVMPQDNKVVVEQRPVVVEPGKPVAPATVTRSNHHPPVPKIVVIQRAVWLVAGLISAAIALRFAFLFFGANQEAGFTSFIYGLTAPFVAPFAGIFGEESVIEASSLLAIAIYLLVAWAITRVLTLTRPQYEI